MVSETATLPTDVDPAAYEAAATGCALVDVSERGKLALTGAEAKEFLHGQVTNDVVSLAPGHGLYAAFLTPKGKMLGDLRIADFGDELWLDCERVALQALFTLIHRYRIGRDVQLHKRTLERGMLSLLGPRARELVRSGDLGPAEHDNAAGELAGRPVRLVATHLGVDVICAAEDTGAVREALLAAGAVVGGDDVAEVLRVERGRPRYGVDLDDSVIPQEAGLNERAVSFTKGCYVGQETVARLHYRGKPNRHLRGIELSEPARAGAELRAADREVGRLSSSVVSPALGPIGLAIVRREVAVGDTVEVAGTGGITARVVELPFTR